MNGPPGRWPGIPGAKWVCLPFCAFHHTRFIHYPCATGSDISAIRERAREEGQAREGSSVCQADLRKVQGHQAPWRCHGDLREPQAQAEAGLSLICCCRHTRRRDQQFWPLLPEIRPIQADVRLPAWTRGSGHCRDGVQKPGWNQAQTAQGRLVASGPFSLGNFPAAVP